MYNGLFWNANACDMNLYFKYSFQCSSLMILQERKMERCIPVEYTFPTCIPYNFVPLTG